MHFYESGAIQPKLVRRAHHKDGPVREGATLGCWLLGLFKFPIDITRMSITNNLFTINDMPKCKTFNSVTRKFGIQVLLNGYGAVLRLLVAFSRTYAITVQCSIVNDVTWVNKKPEPHIYSFYLLTWCHMQYHVDIVFCILQNSIWKWMMGIYI